MPSLRDLVAAICQRDGVDVVVVLGRDGIVIDSHAAVGVDADDLSAQVPRALAAVGDVGRFAALGEFATAVLEFDAGYAVVSSMSADALLLVVLRRGAPVGPLVHELRRNRDRIATLV